MVSCRITRNRVIVLFDDGSRIEVPRRVTDRPEKMIEAVRLLFGLDEAIVDLTET